jgi:hypothetical protein
MKNRKNINKINWEKENFDKNSARLLRWQYQGGGWARLTLSMWLFLAGKVEGSKEWETIQLRALMAKTRAIKKRQKQVTKG